MADNGTPASHVLPTNAPALDIGAGDAHALPGILVTPAEPSPPSSAASEQAVTQPSNATPTNAANGCTVSIFVSALPVAEEEARRRRAGPRLEPTDAGCQNVRRERVEIAPVAGTYVRKLVA